MISVAVLLPSLTGTLQCPSLRTTGIDPYLQGFAMGSFYSPIYRWIRTCSIVMLIPVPLRHPCTAGWLYVQYNFSLVFSGDQFHSYSYSNWKRWKWPSDQHAAWCVWEPSLAETELWLHSMVMRSHSISSQRLRLCPYHPRMGRWYSKTGRHMHGVKVWVHPQV